LVQKRKEELLKKFSENGLLVTSHGFERIIGHSLDADRVISLARESRQWLVSNEFLIEYVENGVKKEEAVSAPAAVVSIAVPAEPMPHHAPLTASLDSAQETQALIVEPPPEIPECRRPAEEARMAVVVEQRGRSIFAKETESQLIISRESDVTGKSTCEGKIEDFVDYFNERYKNLREIIRGRENYLGAVPIEVLKRYKGEASTIVGMIKEKRESKKGYRFLEVEDPTGEISVLIPQNNDALIRLYNTLLEDEVVGIQGKLNNELFIASDIVEPELPVNYKGNYAQEPVYAAFLSDIHVGSNLFLEREFQGFLDWLNLKGGNDDLAGKVKYLLVAGDLVDGIGIYPNQEKELVIPDIYRQYDFLAKLLEGVPDYIEIVLSLGNHDAVRGAEPQPMLPDDLAGRLCDMPNVHLVSNPIWVTVHGVKVLMYHGTSFDTIIGKVPGCSYSKPENAMMECLKKRHLVPMYKEDAISPEKYDYLAIKEVPDVFHAGHVHTNGYANYRGVKIINSGTWQARTKYQEQLGHMPTPGRVPLMNLQTHEISVKHFVE
jgi:DNA polymerase II small subunit